MNAKQLEAHYEQPEVQETVETISAMSYEDIQAAKQADAFDLLEKVADIYKAVRPFLDWADSFFLIPKKIRRVVTVFITFMDGVTDYTAE